MDYCTLQNNCLCASFFNSLIQSKLKPNNSENFNLFYFLFFYFFNYSSNLYFQKLVLLVLIIKSQQRAMTRPLYPQWY
jgi:hypothetical protein